MRLQYLQTIVVFFFLLIVSKLFYLLRICFYFSVLSFFFQSVQRFSVLFFFSYKKKEIYFHLLSTVFEFRIRTTLQQRMVVVFLLFLSTATRELSSFITDSHNDFLRFINNYFKNYIRKKINNTHAQINSCPAILKIKNEITQCVICIKM